MTNSNPSPANPKFPSSARKRAWSALVLATALSATVVFVAGCEGSNARHATMGAASLSPGVVSDVKCEDGAVRVCADEVVNDGLVVQCLTGEQRCEDGAWTPCGGPNRGLLSIPLRRALTDGGGSVSLGGPGQSPQSLSSPSTDTPDCVENVCNPYCWGFEEIPASPLEPTEGSFFLANASEWGNAPGGFIGKQDCGSAGGCSGGYPKNCNGTPLHYNQFDGCLADHHCDPDTDRCERSPAGYTHDPSICPGVDLTIGPWCTEYDDDDAEVSAGFPVCNRGNTEVAAGTTIGFALRTGNWLNLDCDAVNFAGTTKCSHTLSAPLLPGTCARVTECNMNGNVVAFVNWDRAVEECGSPPPSDMTTATAPGCSNNWSDIKKGSNACIVMSATTPWVEVQDYVATCERGTGPIWTVLTYEGEAPCTSCTGDDALAIRFEAQTAPLDDPTAFSEKVVVAEAPELNPARCTRNREAPECPVNLTGALGEVDSRNDVLRLTMTLEPSHGGGLPSLDSWQVSYSCLPDE